MQVTPLVITKPREDGRKTRGFQTRRNTLRKLNAQIKKLQEKLNKSKNKETD